MDNFDRILYRLKEVWIEWKKTWKSIPPRRRTLIVNGLKLAITIGVFVLLFTHRIPETDKMKISLRGGGEKILQKGDVVFSKEGKEVTLDSGDKGIDTSGTFVRFKKGDFVKLTTGESGTVLAPEKIMIITSIWNFLHDPGKNFTASLFVLFLLCAAAIKFTGILCSMYRWHLLLQGQGIRFPFSHLFGSFLIGRFIGTFLPSTIGLDGYKLYDAYRFSRRGVEATAATVIEKVLGIVGIFLTFLVALPLGGGILYDILEEKAIIVIILTVAFSVIAITAFFIALFKPEIIQFFLTHLPLPKGFKKKVKSFIEKVNRSAAAYQHKKLLLINAAFQSFMVHFCTAAMYFFTALAIGATHAEFWKVTFGSSIQIFATVVSPFTVAGEGVREAVNALLLTRHMGVSEAVISAALGFWAAEALTLAGAFFWWVRRRGYHPRFLFLDGKKADVVGLAMGDGGVLPVGEVTIGGEREASPERPAQGKLPVPPPIPSIQANKEFFRRLYLGLIAGLSAGAALGFLEALVVVITKSGEAAPDMGIFPYGVILYGILGALAGAGIGAVFGWGACFFRLSSSSARIYATIFTLWFGINLLMLGRFRVARDVFHESMPMVWNLVILAAVGLIMIVKWISLDRLLRRFPFKLATLPGIGFVPFLLLLALGWILSLGASSPVQGEPGERLSIQAELLDKPNVIVILADALRKDHLSCYGYTGQETPNIDALASDGILFQHAYAQSSWTKPSIATLFTSLYPESHKTYLKPDILPDEVNTLAERLESKDYYTVGFPNNINVTSSRNFQQGFKEYHYLSPDYLFYASEFSSDLLYYSILRKFREKLIKSKRVEHYYQDADVVNERAMRWIEEKGNRRRFFLFLHYMEPHDPYFAHPYNGHGYARVSMPNPKPDLAGEFRQLYDGEIAFMDSRIGELVQFLKERDLYQSALIVFTADHGEEFYDHGGWWHGLTLYQEQIHIPLIVKLPQEKDRGTVVEHFARSLDIAPTILDLMGFAPPKDMQGVPFFSEAGRSLPGIFSQEDHEGNIIASLVEQNWKIIEANEDNRRGLPRFELYDLRQDPGEVMDLSRKDQKKFEELYEKLLGAKEVASRTHVKRKQKGISPAEKAKLKNLGYLGEDE